MKKTLTQKSLYIYIVAFGTLFQNCDDAPKKRTGPVLPTGTPNNETETCETNPRKEGCQGLELDECAKVGKTKNATTGQCEETSQVQPPGNTTFTSAEAVTAGQMLVASRDTFFISSTGASNCLLKAGTTISPTLAGKAISVNPNLSEVTLGTPLSATCKDLKGAIFFRHFGVSPSAALPAK